MGSGPSIPLPDLPSNNLMSVTITGFDSLTLLYAGQPEIDAIRSAIVSTWSQGIKEEKTRYVNETDHKTATRCYVFKIKDMVFSSSSTKSFIRTRKMSTEILLRLEKIGWKLLKSSGLSQISDLATWIFLKSEPCDPSLNMFSAAIVSTDKLQFNDYPSQLHNVLKSVCTKAWSKGIQSEETVEGTLEIKLKGRPWAAGDRVEACMSRNIFKQLIQDLYKSQYSIYGASNTNTYGDTLFFQYDPSIQGEKEYACVGLGDKNVMRFIQMPNALIKELETTVRQYWTKGVQEPHQKDLPLCYELKLNGTPFSSNGEDGQEARFLVVKMMEKMASLGYIIKSGLNISRRKEDKTTLVFEQDTPTVSTYMCLSLTQTDVIRLTNAPKDTIAAVQFAVHQWSPGFCEWITPDDGLKNHNDYMAKLNGKPWHSIKEEGNHGRALLMVTLDKLQSIGWRFMCSAEISAQEVDGHPWDVDSWYFMRVNTV